MSTADSKFLEKSIKVLSEAFKADTNPKSAQLIDGSLKGLCKILAASSRRGYAVRQGEASCMLTFATKYSLVEAYLHYLSKTSSSIKENLMFADEMGRIICFVLYEAPNEKARAGFIGLLAHNMVAEALGGNFLAYIGQNGVLAHVSLEPIINNLVRIGFRELSHQLDRECNRGKHTNGGTFYSIDGPKSSFLLCVFIHAKLLLHSFLASIEPQVRYVPGAHVVPSSSYTGGQSSQSSNCRTGKLPEGDTGQLFLQQQLLRLHGHLLAAVKLLEPTFKLFTTWQNVRDFLLADDLLSIKMPGYILGPGKAEERWRDFLCILQVLCDFLDLQSAPHPLEDVVTEMALEVILALRATNFISALGLVRALGQQVWIKIKRNPYQEKNARLTVRLIFGVQLAMEAMCAFCGLDQDEGDLRHRADPLGEYPTYPGTRSAITRAKKNVAAECLMHRQEVVETASLLLADWIVELEQQWNHTTSAEEGKVAAQVAMHEEAFEALLERQIRWICRPNVRWIPTSDRCFFIKVTATLLSNLIDAPRFCISCHLSLCATLSKVTTLLSEESKSVSQSDEARKLCSLTLGEIFRLFHHWALHAMIGSRISSGIEPLHTLMLPTLGSGDRDPLRYISAIALSGTECVTFAYYSLRTSVRVLFGLVNSGHVTETILEMSSELLKLQTNLFGHLRTGAVPSMKCWVVSLLLDSSYFILLKRIYITAPDEACKSGSTKPSAMSWLLADLLYQIRSLFVTTAQTCSALHAGLALRTVKAKLFDDILSSLASMEPNLEVMPGDSILHLNLIVDISRAPGAVLWALCWVTLYRIVHEVVLMNLKPSPIIHLPVYATCITAWDQLPCLNNFRKQGTGSWVMLRERGSALKKGILLGKVGNAPCWLAKQSPSGDIEQSFYFVPNPDTLLVLMDVTVAWAETLGGKVPVPQHERRVYTEPPLHKTPLIQIGCWSWDCVNISGHSETSLPLRICARCRMARYCCLRCQRADWHLHKEVCKPWQVMGQAASPYA